jgi:hypothetical protein
MLVPDARIAKRFGIPKGALQQAFGRDSGHRQHVARVTEPVREILRAHGMLEPRHARFWRIAGAS